MADISQITLPSGTTYNIKDATARSTMAGAIKIKGTTTTALTDEATTNPITIGGNSYTAVSNDAVFYNKKEFVFDGTKWHEFGDMSGLGALAAKDSASGSYKPEGTLSTPTFTGTKVQLAGSCTPSGSCTGGAVTLNTTTVPNVTNVGTAPSWTATVENEVLTIGWSAGTVPTLGTAKTVATGVKTFTQPTFSGSNTAVAITATESDSGNYTPKGTVSKPTFTGTSKTVTVS